MITVEVCKTIDYSLYSKRGSFVWPGNYFCSEQCYILVKHQVCSINRLLEISFETDTMKMCRKEKKLYVANYVNMLSRCIIYAMMCVQCLQIVLIWFGITWFHRGWCMGLSGKPLMCSWECYFGVFLFLSCFSTQVMNTRITLKWVREQFIMAVNTQFYFLLNIVTL